MNRAVIYFHFNPRGLVDRYVPVVLESLREHCTTILVVVNGELVPEARCALTAASDVLVERPNTDYDVGAYRDGLARLRELGLDDVDEVVLTNHTYFAPLAPWAEVLERTDGWDDVDFWGLTEHRELRPHPFLARASMPAHLSSHWIAVRRRLLAAPEFAEYWQGMPPVRSYRDSIQWHESRFTEYFQSLGFTGRAVYPAERYTADNAAVERPLELLRDGCPIVKRRVFFHDPLHQDRVGTLGADVLDEMNRRGFSHELVVPSVLGAAPLREVVTDLGLTRVLDDRRRGGADAPGGCTLLVAGGSDDPVREVLEAVGSAGHAPALVALSGETVQEGVVATAVGADGHDRVVRPAGAGILGATAAFHDELLALGDHPVLVIAPGAAASDAGAWRRALERSGLGGVGLLEAVRLLEDDLSVSAVLPVPEHLAGGALGQGWRGRREEALALARSLGLALALDGATPVAPLDGVMLLRADALTDLAALADRAARTSDPAVADLLICYVLAAAGRASVEVLGARAAGTQYGLLEYKYQALAARLPHTAEEQLPYLIARTRGVVGLGAVARTTLEARAPGLAASLKPVYRRVTSVASGLRRRT